MRPQDPRGRYAPVPYGVTARWRCPNCPSCAGLQSPPKFGKNCIGNFWIAYNTNYTQLQKNNKRLCKAIYSISQNYPSGGEPPKHYILWYFPPVVTIDDWREIFCYFLGKKFKESIAIWLQSRYTKKAQWSEMEQKTTKSHSGGGEGHDRDIRTRH